MVVKPGRKEWRKSRAELPAQRGGARRAIRRGIDEAIIRLAGRPLVGEPPGQRVDGEAASLQEGTAGRERPPQDLAPALLAAAGGGYLAHSDAVLEEFGAGLLQG